VERSFRFRQLSSGPGRRTAAAPRYLFGYYLDTAGFLMECSSGKEMIGDRNGFWPRVVDVPPDLSDPKLVNRRSASAAPVDQAPLGFCAVKILIAANGWSR
jgi:hypothetical protein